ncbi:MAG: sigma-54-dependent Fis family transcriptional regulator [Flavobacteriales bacterium]|nr:sigma-54-dependent Fis family transcriptional regulator [Flavobacteriales bacterium]
MPKILIIEDERSIRNVLQNILSDEDKSYEVFTAEDGKKGLKIVNTTSLDLVLCDIKMPGMDGVEVLEEIVKHYPGLPVLMISGHGDIDTAVETIRKGAYDYISKPPDLNRLLNSVRNALDKGSLVEENIQLKKRVSKKYEMIGSSPKLLEIKEMIDKVAPSDARVMITGPNGSGKEIVAHWIHEKSSRSSSAMLEVNCAAIPSELIESELFGHEKGAFTSANKQRKGKFELANGGTIFLDEIGDMSLSAQAKVLRVLQENKITRVGGDKSINVDVRVVAATNKDLKKEIEAGKFREDLYHRLAVIPINVPSLNQRSEDIPELIEHFSRLICGEQGISTKKFDSSALKLLQKKDWSGNIRELRNVVERLIILGGKTVSKADVEKFV